MYILQHFRQSKEEFFRSYLTAVLKQCYKLNDRQIISDLYVDFVKEKLINEKEWNCSKAVFVDMANHPSEMNKEQNNLFLYDVIEKMITSLLALESFGDYKIFGFYIEFYLRLHFRRQTEEKEQIALLEEMLYAILECNYLPSTIQLELSDFLLNYKSALPLLMQTNENTLDGVYNRRSGSETLQEMTEECRNCLLEWDISQMEQKTITKWLNFFNSLFILKSPYKQIIEACGDPNAKDSNHATCTNAMQQCHSAGLKGEVFFM